MFNLRHAFSIVIATFVPKCISANMSEKTGINSDVNARTAYPCILMDLGLSPIVNYIQMHTLTVAFCIFVAEIAVV